MKKERMRELGEASKSVYVRVPVSMFIFSFVYTLIIVDVTGVCSDMPDAPLLIDARYPCIFTRYFLWYVPPMYLRCSLVRVSTLPIL